MDAYKVQVRSSVRPGLCELCACICGLAACAVPITFIVYLGIFAINNPNGDGWYGVAEGFADMRPKKDWDRSS